MASVVLRIQETSMTKEQIENIQKEAMRLHQINETLNSDVPEENDLLTINHEKIRQMKETLDRFVKSQDTPALRVISGGKDN